MSRSARPKAAGSSKAASACSAIPKASTWRRRCLTETAPAMRINREEVFGPVASVIRVRDYDEALAVANDDTRMD